MSQLLMYILSKITSLHVKNTKLLHLQIPTHICIEIFTNLKGYIHGVQSISVEANN